MNQIWQGGEVLQNKVRNRKGEQPREKYTDFWDLFVLVDGWYQEHADFYRQGKPRQKPEFRDSEVMTIILAMDFIPFPSERQFVEFVLRTIFHCSQSYWSKANLTVVPGQLLHCWKNSANIGCFI